VPLRLAIDLPQPPGTTAQAGQLVDVDNATLQLPAQLAPRLAADGTSADANGTLLSIVPPNNEGSPRKFKWVPATQEAVPEAAFSFATIEDKTVKLTEGDKPVLAYNYGVITGENVPENDGRRQRACYIHPVWGLDGEVLTDDFPKDHYHHHGIFWTWPHIKVGDKEYDLWVGANIQQRFVRWLYQQTGPVAAVLGVENGWFIGDRQVMTERVWVRVFRAGDRDRSLDIEIFLIPNEELSLQGAPGKSYGGLTVRFAVRGDSQVAITAPSGLTKEDLPETHLEWADLTARFEDAPDRSGGAVFVHPQHPDFPPTWLTRHYGPLCVGWPGVNARTYQPGQSYRLPYRIWLHAGAADHERLKTEYDALTTASKLTWSQP
jgi:hypothetical protein